MKLEKSEKQLLKMIQSGMYRDFYLIYNRKSTDEPDNQKNSIKYQKAENARFASKEKLRIAPITLKSFCVDGIISEKHSGFKEDNEISINEAGMVQFRIDRPKFQRLIQFLSLGLFKGIVVLCWDRVSRNKGDDTVIRKLMRKGIDVRFVFAKYEKTSSGALHMDIDGMFAEHHSRVTSEKVKTTTWNLRERGICTYRAPIGYLNLGKMEEKPFDPVRAPIIKRIYELYASGDWSLEDLARYAKKEGLTTIPMRRRRTEEEMLAEEDEEIEIEQVARPITANMVHKILTNPFYKGLVLGNNHQYIPSISHQPLVTHKLFDDVQALLFKRKTSLHYTDKLDLYHRGIFRCSLCNRTYTPYMKKGIQYFNARCPAGCANPRKNFNIKFIEEKVGELLTGLHFNDKELIEIDARTRTDIALFEEKRHIGLEDNERQKKKIREQLKYLHTNKLDLLIAGTYSAESYLAEENKLNDELKALQGEEQASDEAMHEVIKDILKLSELVKNVAPYYQFAKPHEKEQIVRVIFSELSLSQNTLQFKCKKGFECFENRFLAVCDPTGNRTLVNGLKTRCPSR